MKNQIILGIALLVSGSAAFAQSSNNVFGSLPDATFNGTAVSSGNPTYPVDITTVTDGAGSSIVLGLAAQGRYSNPVLTYNTTTATYYAGPGVNDGLVTPAKSIASTWNFDFYINNTGGIFSADTFQILYSLTANGPADNVWKLGAGIGVISDSENLTFGFLNTSTSYPGGSTTVNSGPYDPNATGDYQFVIQAINANGGVDAQAAIDVQVANAPEISSTAALFCLALGGLGAYSRMRRQSVA
jgi:hypothetical protein